jgi:hypothetical protein
VSDGPKGRKPPAREQHEARLREMRRRAAADNAAMDEANSRPVEGGLLTQRSRANSAGGGHRVPYKADGRRVMVMGKVAVARRERLHRLCKSIVDDPASIDGDTKAALKTAALKYAHTQYDDPTQVLKRLYLDDGELGSLLRKAVEVVTKQRDDCDDEIDDALDDDRDERERNAERDDDGNGDDTEKGVDHHASVVADLLVESGKYPHRAAALDHVLHSATGQALLARMHKAAETAKEQPMTHENILKDYGAVKICKHIVAEGKTGYDEHTLVSALTRYASEQFNLPGDRAFAKLYESEESVRRACNIAKSMPVTPTMVGGVDATHEAIDSTESSTAYEQLTRMAEKMREASPELSAAQAFDRVFTDKRNASLAAKAHVRPSPTTFFPMPR